MSEDELSYINNVLKGNINETLLFDKLINDDKLSHN